MARFTIYKMVASGQTQALGMAVANALNLPTTQSVEVVLRNSGYEVRAWQDLRDDGSNRISASPNVDYGDS